MVFVGFGVVRYDVLLPFEWPFLAENFSEQGTWGIVRNHTMWTYDFDVSY